MNTYAKSTYAFGDKLELLQQGKQPPPRGFLAVNARRFAMIATRLAQVGDYSEVEEELQLRAEKEMVKPALKFGASINALSKSDPEQLEEAKRSQIRAAKAIRDASSYGDSSIWSGDYYKMI